AGTEGLGVPAQGGRRHSESGLRPLVLGNAGQGEAASYYNPATPGLASSAARGGGEERERGRSATREPAGARSLSADTRGRPQSTSRFREEGMVDLDVGKH